MSASSMELLDALRRHSRDRAEHAAVREISSGRSMTYAQLAYAVDEFSAEIRRTTPKDSVVLLRCPNTANYHISFLGALQAGFTIFPVPEAIASREFDLAAERSAAAAVIDAQLKIRPLENATPNDSLTGGLLLQSSGTTGLPKIVYRDAAAIDAVASNVLQAVRFEPSDSILSCVPLCHSYGLEHGLLAPLLAGATVHLAEGFDLPVIRRELATSGVTLFPAVPSIFEMLANLPEQSTFPALLHAYAAGSPLPMSVYSKMLEHYNVRVAQLYGATEFGSATFAHPTSPHFNPASVGTAMNNIELRVDADQQLLVRGSSMLSRYVGDATPFSSDGYFPTGDLARIDAYGNLTITGRIKLLIDVGGLKVNPLEVEQTIAEHPDVAACVVVPVRLSETISRVKAIVTPRDPARPPAGDSLRQFTRERLSAYKVPRLFEIRPTLPRSATGKVLRHLLVEST